MFGLQRLVFGFGLLKHIPWRCTFAQEKFLAIVDACRSFQFVCHSLVVGLRARGFET